ncbi:hypothetical protein Bbelb_430890 [Branchiostoma belcheri]|nr:hypothetical protein Bbelb_430890 [Branchiostoma belcheri]
MQEVIQVQSVVADVVERPCVVSVQLCPIKQRAGDRRSPHHRQPYKPSDTIYPHNLSSHQLLKGRRFHKLAGLRGAGPVWPLLSGDERQLQVTVVVRRSGRGGDRHASRGSGARARKQAEGGRVNLPGPRHVAAAGVLSKAGGLACGEKLPEEIVTVRSMLSRLEDPGSHLLAAEEQPSLQPACRPRNSCNICPSWRTSELSELLNEADCPDSIFRSLGNRRRKMLLITHYRHELPWETAHQTDREKWTGDGEKKDKFPVVFLKLKTKLHSYKAFLRRSLTPQDLNKLESGYQWVLGWRCLQACCTAGRWNPGWIPPVPGLASLMDKDEVFCAFGPGGRAVETGSTAPGLVLTTDLCVQKFVW